MMKDIAVLGAGAAGQFAALAAHDLGHRVTIITTKNFYAPPGPFWFHWVPDSLKDKVEPVEITLIPDGTEKEYQSLQWGRAPHGISSSFPKKITTAIGYNPVEVVWGAMPSFKIHKLSSKEKLNADQIEVFCDHYDLVFQTFPTDLSKDIMKPKQPYFVGEKLNFAPANGDKDNFVVYNGTGKGIWVRKVFLWGNLYFEFPKNLSLDMIEPVMERTHPDLTYHQLWDLNPYGAPYQLGAYAPRNLHLVGRWAEWNTKRLSHEAYDIAKELINGCL